MHGPELLFTVLQRGEAVSIVRARSADGAIDIAAHMLEALGPIEAPLQARSATPFESLRFFDHAQAWSGGLSLAGIVLSAEQQRPLH
jgi:hypothetical protein